jgi:hypothetical protein
MVRRRVNEASNHFLLIEQVRVRLTIVIRILTDWWLYQLSIDAWLVDLHQVILGSDLVRDHLLWRLGILLLLQHSAVGSLRLRLLVLLLTHLLHLLLLHLHVLPL